MTVERSEKSLMETDSQIAFYGRDKMLQGLRQSEEYLRQENELHDKGKKMISRITLQIGDANYKDFEAIRNTEIRGRLVRTHETKVILRRISDDETKIKFYTIVGETERIARVTLIANNTRYEGHEAVDMIEVSFPELFPQKP